MQITAVSVIGFCVFSCGDLELDPAGGMAFLVAGVLSCWHGVSWRLGVGEGGGGWGGGDSFVPAVDPCSPRTTSVGEVAVTVAGVLCLFGHGSESFSCRGSVL